MEAAYFSSEVAKSLGIGASTLRKYALALEEQGYNFDRGINNSRVFYQKDVLVIQRLIAAITNQNMSLEQAIKLAVAMNTENTVATSATIEEQSPSPFKELCDRIEALEKNQNRLIEVNLTLAKQFEDQKSYITNKLEERDRALMTSLRTIQEEKEKQNQSSFWSIFSIFSKKRENNFD
ncbi:hypothetical protein [Bacillus taeanensis]|uniref:hypothetical protein n=1 Tax=Bacillus taeanensis TaxID=273032 RepID=UPI001FE3473F|nr:hypothetical protein [Bacillus taeanensis]